MRINPLRTVLSTLGVIIGVGSLVAVLSLGDGMERSARSRMASTSVLAIMVASSTTETVDGEIFPLAQPTPLTPADADAIRRLPSVQALSVTLQRRMEIRGNGNRRMATLTGIRGDVDSPPTLVAGRLLTAADEVAPTLPVVLTQLLADRLLGDSALGRWVALGTAGDSAQVVGVIATPEGPGASSALVPYDALQKMLQRRGAALPEIVLRVADVEEVASTQRAIEAYLATKSVDWKRLYSVQTYRRIADQISQGIVIFKLLMGALTGISLVVGGIGIMNVLLASVSERTREIGIRRAAGATRRDILLQFLSEAVTISGIGSAFGIVLGLTVAFGVTALIRRFAKADFLIASFSWSSALAAALAAVIVGLLFGTYPAKRAAQLNPIDAIRHE